MEAVLSEKKMQKAGIRLREERTQEPHLKIIYNTL